MTVIHILIYLILVACLPIAFLAGVDYGRWTRTVEVAEIEPVSIIDPTLPIRYKCCDHCFNANAGNLHDDMKLDDHTVPCSFKNCQKGQQIVGAEF